eukprot:SAG11_NODE_2226_length_3663_cov_1.716891_3_plen_117_part_00
MYCSYQSVQVVCTGLAADDPVYQLLYQQFLRTASTHQRSFSERRSALGPALDKLQGDRPMQEITKIIRLYNPRLQKKYETEIEDIAGLVHRWLAARSYVACQRWTLCASSRCTASI